MKRNWTAVAVCALLVACQGAAAQTSKPAPHEMRLQELLDRGQAEEAARYWGDNRSYFWDNAERNKPLLTRLRDTVNPPYEAKMSAAAAALQPYAASAVQAQPSWSGVSHALAEARRTLDAYRVLPIAVDDFLRSERSLELDAVIGQVTDLYVKEAPAAFARYEHFGHTPFAKVYPVEVPDEAIAAGYSAMKARFERASAEQIAGFVETYGKALTPQQKSELAAAAGRARYRAIVPDGVITGERAMRLLSEITSGRLDPSGLPVKVTLFWSKEGADAGEFPVALKSPAAFSATELSKRDLPAKFAETEIVLFVDVHRTVVARATRGSRQERSSYKASTRQVPNPAWQQAQANLMQKQQEYQALSNQNQQLQNQARQISGGGLAGFAALLGSAAGHGAMLAASSQVRTAQTQLSNTPQMLSEDVLADYQFTVSEIEVTRRAPATVYLIDVKNGRYFKHTTEKREARKFESAEVDPRDPQRDSILSRYTSAENVKVFTAAPETLEAQSLLEGLKGASAPQPLTALDDDIDRERLKVTSH